MNGCIDHGEDCPYRSHRECNEMVRLIRAAMWNADEIAKRQNRRTSRYVRDSLIPALSSLGLKIVKRRTK